jgi:hypothetical protein
MNTSADRTASRVLNVLGLYGEVDWARVSLGEDRNGELVGLPMIVWRFHGSSAAAAKRVAERLSACIERSWLFESRGRNSVLWPRVLADEFAAGAWRTDTDAALALVRADRELAGRLLGEFWAIVACLEGDDDAPAPA